MRFDLTEEQRGIRDAVRALCRQQYDTTALRRRIDGGDTGDALWRALSGAGWPGVAIAEAHQGQGLGVVELSLACEELGTALAPATFIGNAAAAQFVEYIGTPEQRTRWLGGIASGEAPGAIALIREDGSGLALDAVSSEVLVLVGEDEVRLALTESCTLESIAGVDLTRRLSRVTDIGQSERLDGDIECVRDRVEVTLAAELVGVGQRALDLAVTHAKTREQFGRAIGGYQAVSHRLADMLVDVESARSAVLSAAWTADHNVEALPFAASVAKIAAAQAAWRAAAGSLQIHGGIGFTWEHECHLLLRRAAATSHLLHDTAWHIDRVASLRGLG